MTGIQEGSRVVGGVTTGWKGTGAELAVTWRVLWSARQIGTADQSPEDESESLKAFGMSSMVQHGVFWPNIIKPTLP